MKMKYLFFTLSLAPFALFGVNVLGDGECRIETQGDGTWTIVCNGDGINWNTVWRTNDVFVIEDCEQLKLALLQAVGSINSSARYIHTANDTIYNAYVNMEYDETINSTQTFMDFYQVFNEQHSVIGENSIQIENETRPDGSSDNLYHTIRNIQCGSCPTNGVSGGEGGGSCCDFTEILNRMVQAQDQRDTMIESLQGCVGALSTISNLINYSNFLQEHGWRDSTNLLSDIISRFVIQTDDESDLINDPSWPYYFQKADGKLVPNMGPYYVYSPATIASALEAINWTLGEEVTSLNNYHYNFQQRLFPIVTNYFTFFRGEIGVRGVLEDWQSEQVSGSYHDFLTNHYLTVVRGGSLSGNQSSKTNWFSRIETLLASLVFTDSSETNTVDTSAGQEEQSQLSSSYATLNQSAGTFSESFKSSSQSIVDLYRTYFTTFETATMPSHVVLVRLSGDSGEEDIEISFQSDSVSVLVEGCRVVSTFCWASVGIFLLYKFLVWAARCIVVTCQFIYRLISSIFK